MCPIGAGRIGDVYIYYTLHKDAAGSVVLTELKLTSRANQWRINFSSSTEKAIFALIKEKALKEAPIAMRSYDEITKIWLFIEDWGPKVIARAKALCSVLGGIIVTEVPDLNAIATAQYFDPKKIKLPPKPEDFFYRQQAPAASKSAMTKEQVQQKLAAMGVTDKKSYRAAALKLHPDRNNGDGSAMSELNMLWQLWGGV